MSYMLNQPGKATVSADIRMPAGGATQLRPAHLTPQAPCVQVPGSAPLSVARCRCNTTPTVGMCCSVHTTASLSENQLQSLAGPQATQAGCITHTPMLFPQKAQGRSPTPLYAIASSQHTCNTHADRHTGQNGQLLRLHTGAKGRRTHRRTRARNE